MTFIAAAASFGAGLAEVVVPAHILALLALGLLLGQQAPSDRRAELALFALALFGTMVAIVRAVAIEDAQQAVLVAAAILGVLVAVARPVRIGTRCALAVIAGGAVEFDSVPHEISMLASFVALAGTAIGALFAAAVVAHLVAMLGRHWQRIGVRVLGSWIAASAILVLALRFAK